MKLSCMANESVSNQGFKLEVSATALGIQWNFVK